MFGNNAEAVNELLKLKCVASERDFNLGELEVLNGYLEEKQVELNALAACAVLIGGNSQITDRANFIFKREMKVMANGGMLSEWVLIMMLETLLSVSPAKFDFDEDELIRFLEKVAESGKGDEINLNAILRTAMIADRESVDRILSKIRR